jgi:hypothetical protein
LRRHLSMALPFDVNRGRNYCPLPEGTDVTRISHCRKNVTRVSFSRGHIQFNTTGALETFRQSGSFLCWIAMSGDCQKLDAVLSIMCGPHQYAKVGFPVTQMIAMNWQRNIALFEANLAMIEEFENARHVYVVDRRTPVEGQVVRNPDLAATLEKLAQGERSACYEGAVAKTSHAPVVLHSQMAEYYQSQITRLITALNATEMPIETNDLIRSLIERIVFTPNEHAV